VSPTQGDQHGALVKLTDEKLATTRDHITKADEQIARLHEELSRLDTATKRHPSVTNAPATAPRRAAPPRGRPVKRVLVSLLLAAVICVTAIAWRSPLGDEVRSVFGPSIPQLAQAPLQKNMALAQPASSVVQPAAVDPPRREPSAQLAQPNATAGADASPQLEETLQTMTRALASLGQTVEQLRVSQEQAASDTTKAMEELKDNQEKLAAVLARLSEQSLQARKPAAAPGPTPLPTQRPLAASVPTRQQTPAQLRADDPRTSSSPRPPMQLH